MQLTEIERDHEACAILIMLRLEFIGLLTEIAHSWTILLEVRMRVMVYLLMAFISVPCMGAQQSSNLNGLWKAEKFECEDGSKSPFVSHSNKLLQTGRTDETLNIHGDQAVFEMKNWSSSKKTYCQQNDEEVWDVGTGSFHIVSRNLPPVENHGRTCPVLEQSSPPKVGYKFILSANELKIETRYAKKYLSANEKRPCGERSLFTVYSRIQ